MKRNFYFLSLLMPCLSVAYHATPGFAEDHSHPNPHPPHHDTHVPKPDQKFTADENLKPRMDTLFEILRSLPPPSPQERLRFQQAGQKIEATVRDIFKNCKLPPDADAAIHPILADLLKSAKSMKNQQEKLGYDLAKQSLLQYENYFDAPQWSTDKPQSTHPKKDAKK